MADEVHSHLATELALSIKTIQSINRLCDNSKGDYSSPFATRLFIGELIQMTQLELLKLPHIGRQAIHEIEQGLETLGLQLGTTIEGAGCTYLLSRVRDRKSGEADLAHAFNDRLAEIRDRRLAGNLLLQLTAPETRMPVNEWLNRIRPLVTSDDLEAIQGPSQRFVLSERLKLPMPTQESLADFMGITPQSVGNLEKKAIRALSMSIQQKSVPASTLR